MKNVSGVLWNEEAVSFWIELMPTGSYELVGVWVFVLVFMFLFMCEWLFQ